MTDDRARAGPRGEVGCERPSCYHRRQVAGAIWGISAELMTDELPESFPRIARKFRRQMKDVEPTAELMLYVDLFDALNKRYASG